jgi:hypothetical protein
MSRWILGALVVFLAACDPGASFRVPDAKKVQDSEGRRFELAGPSQTFLTVHAGTFTINTSVDLTVRNDGASPLTVGKDGLHLYDHRGKDAPGSHGPEGYVCAGRTETEEVVLAPGESCKLSGRFRTGYADDEIATLRLTHDRIRRDGALVPIEVKLLRD